MMKPHALFFDSGGLRCAADLYWPADTNGPVPCVVMGHGFSGTRDMGLAPYAERFAAAGMAVLVFDYRHFGASDGQPRQLIGLCIAIIVSGVSRVSVGILALSLAWLIGSYVAGMKASAIVAGFPIGLAIMLFGRSAW